MRGRGPATTTPTRWRELVAPWGWLVAVLACAGCYTPAIALALGLALDALVSSRAARDALRAMTTARRRDEPTGATGAAVPAGACLVHTLLDDDSFRALLAHLDARSLESVASSDRRCRRLARDDDVWRAVVARVFGGAIADHLPRGLLAAAPTGRAPLAALQTALAALRPSPCWWRADERSAAAAGDAQAAAAEAGADADGGGCCGTGAPGRAACLDPQLCAAAAAVCALARARGPPGRSDAAAGDWRRRCEWRVYYYLLQATWRRLAVAPHASAADCWMVVGAHVCDVSAFLARHPGEAGPLLLFGGLDATAAFDATGHSFARPYFHALDVPGLQRPVEGRPADVERAWARAQVGGAREAAGAAGWGGAPDAADASGGSSPVRRAPSLSALATLGWSLVPQIGLVAWGDEPAGRELSYHDFVQLRGTTAH